MNNSQIIFNENESSFLEVSQDATNALREREAHIMRVIEAIEGIMQSHEWSTLKELIFSNLVESLEKQLKWEAEQETLNAPHIHKLQGELTWARKYADLEKLAQSYKVELTGIRKLTQPTER